MNVNREPNVNIVIYCGEYNGKSISSDGIFRRGSGAPASVAIATPPVWQPRQSDVYAAVLGLPQNNNQPQILNAKVSMISCRLFDLLVCYGFIYKKINPILIKILAYK